MAIGDIAMCTGDNGRPLPGLAPVAMQQGDYAAARIIASLAGRPMAKPFHYRDRGSMAVIGRYRAVAMVGRRQLSGFMAWVVWLGNPLMENNHFSNRVLVLNQWAGSFFSHNRSARLITHDRASLIATKATKDVAG